MVLMARGPKEFKFEMLREWLGKYRINQYERDYLEKLLAGDSVPNHFVNSFFRQQSYILDRLCRAESVNRRERDKTLFEMGPKVQLLERIRRHPMMQSHLKITST